MKRTKRAKLLERNNTPVNLVPEEKTVTQHPLLIDVILQNIFKYLTFEDLRSCRQLGNRTWLRNTDMHWRSHTKLVCRSGEEQLTNFKDYLSQPDVASKATSFTFQHVDLEKLDLLWTSFGHSIKHLEIINGYFNSAKKFREIIFTKCPNLEKLVFKGPILDHNSKDRHAEPVEWENPQLERNGNLKYFESDEVSLPVSWLEFLSHYSGLQALKVHTLNLDIYKTISIIRKRNPKLLELKHIEVRHNIPGEFDASISDVFLNSKLSLEKIYISRSNCQPETIQGILKLHSKSLKELAVHGNHLGHLEADRPLSLPEPFEKLETFEAVDCVFTADVFQNTPNVRKVKLDYRLSLHNLSPGVVPNLIINSCKELSLHIHRRLYEQHKQDLKFVMNLFPNVQTLEIIDINNLQFSRICERWKYLRQFVCNWSSEVDATGLLGYDPDSSASNGVRRPNIADLRDLQCFTMISREGLEMKHARLILKELQGLPKLNKFHLSGYNLIQKGVWKKIFAKYSGKRKEDNR